MFTVIKQSVPGTGPSGIPRVRFKEWDNIDSSSNAACYRSVWVTLVKSSRFGCAQRLWTTGTCSG